jgi:hypothetical protein
MWWENPPLNTIVLCVDEKSHIQALERTHPILPIIRDVPERQSIDYERHGTTTLFAALDLLTGNVSGECKETHHSNDFIAFLRRVDKSSPEGKVPHLVADTVSTHKTKKGRVYLSGG